MREGSEPEKIGIGELSSEDFQTFREITNIFRNEFQNSVIRPAHRLLGTAPSSFGNAYNSLHKLEGDIQPGTGEHKISSDLVP